MNIRDRKTRWAGMVVAIVLLAVACGSDEDPAVDAAPGAASTTAAPEPEPSDAGGDGSPAVTACELFTLDDAESVVGTDLVDNSRDDDDCTFFSEDNPLISASISIRPWAATGADITALHDALPEGTLEDIADLGEAAVYYQDGASHSLQFVKGGVYVTTIVTALPDDRDVRDAEMAIAEIVAARLESAT